MTTLVAAVVLVGMLAALNLLLTLAVLRRLQERTASFGPSGPYGPDDALDRLVGTAVPDVVGLAGALPEVDLAGAVSGQPTLIAFFTTACPSCRTEVVEFARAAGREPGSPATVLAVIAGDDADGRSRLTATLGGVAVVLTEPEDGPVTRAFGVQAFPTIARTDGAGRVVAASASVRSLRRGAPVPAPSS